MKYIKLYEEERLTQDDLDRIYSMGIINKEEYFMQLHENFPEKFKKAEVQLTFDWNWAYNTSSEEGERLVRELLMTSLDRYLPEGSAVIRESIYVDSWDESDFVENTEDEEDEDFLPDFNYGFSPMATFDIIFDSTRVSEEKLKQLIDDYGGRTFEFTQITF